MSSEIGERDPDDVLIATADAPLDDLVWLDQVYERLAYNHFLEAMESTCFYSINDPRALADSHLFVPLGNDHNEKPAHDVQALMDELMCEGDTPALTDVLMALLLDTTGTRCNEPKLNFEADDGGVGCASVHPTEPPPTESGFGCEHFFRIVAKSPGDRKLAHTDLDVGLSSGFSAVSRHDVVMKEASHVVVKLQASGNPSSAAETTLLFSGAEAVRTIRRWEKQPGSKSSTSFREMVCAMLCMYIHIYIRTHSLSNL